jgi:hypothetical protein
VARGLRSVLSILCIVLAGLAAYNVFGDHDEVQRAAERAACGGSVDNCRPAMTRMERAPWATTFEFSTRKGPASIRCMRAAIFVGDYACKPL